MYAASRDPNPQSQSFMNQSHNTQASAHGTGASQARENIYLVARQERERCMLGQIFLRFRANFRSFDTVSAYLEHGRTDEPSCLIVDIESDEQHGEDLPARIGGQTSPPVILLSEHVDISATVRAIRSGVLEFLLKPVEPFTLREAVATAMTIDEKRSFRRAELVRLEGCYSLLTPRERQVLPLIVGGLLNKQAASVLGISEVTLQIHRSQIMRKMQATCFADLVRMAVKLHIPHSRPDALRPQIRFARDSERGFPSCPRVRQSHGSRRHIAAAVA